MFNTDISMQAILISSGAFIFCLIILVLINPKMLKSIWAIWFLEKPKSEHVLLEKQDKFKPPFVPVNADDLIAVSQGRMQ